MKNKLLIVALVVIAGTGIWFWQSMSGSEKVMTDDRSESRDAMIKDESSKENDQAMMTAESGKYVEYSKEQLEAGKDGRRVLFFFANWCPICRPADADIRANEGNLPEDLSVVRVNYNDSDTDDEEKELAVKYGVSYQHTFVQIDSAGNIVTQWNGGRFNDIIKNVK